MGNKKIRVVEEWGLDDAIRIDYFTSSVMMKFPSRNSRVEITRDEWEALKDYIKKAGVES